MTYNQEKKVAIEAARKGGDELVKYFKKVDTLKVNKKSKHELVTPADLASNKTIINYLSKKFPGHGFLSEETGQDRTRPEYMWVLDPLDGTTNFSIGNHFFNVSLALIHKGEIILGIVWAPLFNQLFVAEKNKGTYLNNKKVKVSSEKKVSNAIVDFGYTYKENSRNVQVAKTHAYLLGKFEHTNNLGAAALELAWVAMGRLEGYILPHTKPWDIAAGVLLVQEAGGKVTDFKGTPYKFTTSDKGNLVVSNKHIHPACIKAANV